MAGTPHILLVLTLLFLLSACATTRVAIVEDKIIGQDDIHIFVSSDEVDDPLDVGIYLKETFEEHGISAELRPKEKAVTQSGSGSGFVVADGYWITNNHVVDDLDSLTVGVVGRNIPATLVTSDPDMDLAILKADTTGLKPIKIGTAELGEEIYVVGYPIPDTLGNCARITTGVVSSLRGLKGDPDNIQISAPIQPGNSGGPAIGADWELAGVVVATSTGLGQAEVIGVLTQNVNYAVSTNLLKGYLLQNNIEQDGPYAESVSDIVASTGMIWNGDVNKQKKTYVALFGYFYYWDIVYHLKQLEIRILDASTGKMLAKTTTRAREAGVQRPCTQAVEELVERLKLAGATPE